MHCASFLAMEINVQITLRQLPGTGLDAGPGVACAPSCRCEDLKSHARPCRQYAATTVINQPPLLSTVQSPVDWVAGLSVQSG